MFCRNIASAIADIAPVDGWKSDANRLATPIAVRTPGHCRLPPTNRG
ncbi:MAG: hypothetical protein LBC02_10660 [Planctomycetaceae bacterium]|nr:hypothetical protein [Planctomycetaceae bacterium]